MIVRYARKILMLFMVFVAINACEKAAAETSVYSHTRTTINCGILKTGGISNPYVFYIMDQRKDMKPAGWEFDNPTAPSIASSDDATRWGISAGQRISKDMAAYWEVDLSKLSDDKLAMFDVLLIASNSTVTLSSEWREKLRRFVDSGGLLWIDKTGAMVFRYDSFFVPLTFGGPTTVPHVASFGHPLLNSPYPISPAEALNLGMGETGSADASSLMLSGMWVPIVLRFGGGSTAGGASLATATYGSGHIVVTTTNVTGAINGPVGAGSTYGGGGANSGAKCGTNFLAASTPDLKLAFNMVSWANAHQTVYKNSRHTNANFLSSGAPLTEKWTIPMGSSQSPAIFNGVIYVVDGNTLAAFDALPNRDLDGDGNPDDGALKGTNSGGPIDDSFMTGSSLNSSDLLWSIELPSSSISSPTIADVMIPGYIGGAVTLVLVTDNVGTLYAYHPLPKNNRGLISPVGILACPPLDCPVDPVDLSTAPTGSVGSNALGVPAPTYAEGIIVVTVKGGVYLAKVEATSSGNLKLEYIFSPTTTGTPKPWMYPHDNNGKTQLGSPIGPATLGYTPRAASNSSDKVIYVNTGAVSSPVLPAGVKALWLGSKGEELRRLDANGTRWATQAASSNLKIYTLPYSQDPRLGYIVRDETGQIITSARPSDPSVVGEGAGNFIVSSGFANAQDKKLYADYTIDWTPDPLKSSGIRRTFLQVPDKPAAPEQTPTGPVALGKNGNIYFITDGDTNPGSLWAVQENRGATRLLYRWQLPGTTSGNYTHPLTGSNSVVVAGLPSLDLFTGNGKAEPITGLEFIKNASPVVRNNTVYVLAKGRRGVLPVTVLMAFDGNPGSINLKVGTQITGISNSVLIRQPDLQRADNPNDPNIKNAFVYLDSSQYTLDRERGVIRINNFMQLTSGQINGALSVSMPVGIQYGGGTEILLYPEDNGSNWNTMLWYVAIPLFDATSPPMVAGDLIYITGKQTMQDPGGNMTTGAIVYAFDADISPSDPYLLTAKMPNSLSVKQMTLAIPQADGTFKANPHLRWPSAEGITSLSDFNKKIYNYKIDGDPKGLLASEEMLVLATNSAIRVFERGVTLIADSGRIIEVDSEGLPVLSMDATLYGETTAKPIGATISPSMMKTNRLVQPTRVYRTAPTEMLIVDTGGNRVVRAHRSGLETRSIIDFTVDSKHIPTGYKDGDPTKLLQPRDASYWSDYIEQNINPFKDKNPLEYWDHYLIADYGNNRIVEIVDRFIADPITYAIVGPVYGDNKRYSGELLWHSLSDEVGQLLRNKTYSYTALKRLQTGVQNINNVEYPVYSYFMMFGNVKPERATLGLDTPNASEPREAALGGGIIIQTGNSIAIVNNIECSVYDGTGYKLVKIPMRDPVCFDVRHNVSGAAGYEALLVTADGVFEVDVPAVGTGTGETWRAKWALLNEDYQNGLRNKATAKIKTSGFSTEFNIISGGIPLRASGARWMPNGDIMITNSWSGKVYLGKGIGNEEPANPEYDFFGEVFVLKRGDYKGTGAAWHGWTNTNSIVQSIPPLLNTFGLRQPQFADRPY